MEQLLRLKEFQGPNLLFFTNKNCNKDSYGFCQEPTSYYIGDMIYTVGHKLLYNLNPKVYLPNTEEISTAALDTDSLMNKKEVFDNDITLGKTTDEIKRGKNVVYLSLNQFNSNEEIVDRYRYILECYYESLKKYFERFKIDMDGLNYSYEKLKTSDFYQNSVVEKHEKKGFIAIIQKRVEVSDTKWRFRLLNAEKIVVFEQNLKTFDFYGKRIKDGHWIQTSKDEKPPSHSYLSLKKWLGDTFYFTWGIPKRANDVEYYEFSLKTMEIIRTA